jgi:hypothetical protein
MICVQVEEDWEEMAKSITSQVLKEFGVAGVTAIFFRIFRRWYVQAIIYLRFLQDISIYIFLLNVCNNFH